ncbi:MAG: hypothetical protein NC251_06350 [Lachnoclostridium sp.]|nr:hypothetical protein [Lachnospira sp.]MCM1248035.1 hypothetical protein [Lachnoclostridium sp.]MCM1535852.1 hypothetical protein [Clostridium sp.]
MNKQRKIFSINLVLVVLVMTLGYSDMAHAAVPKRIPNRTKTTYVGSTKVYMEIGCNNGTYVYALVSASNDVDVVMEMTLYYNNGQEQKEIMGGFDQRTYGEMEYTCSSRVSKMECYITISSEDAGETFYLPLTIPE